MVVLRKRALRISAEAVNDWVGVGAGSVWGLALPVCHVGGFGVVARGYFAGCEVVSFEGKWGVDGFCEWVDKVGVTHVSLVPTQVHDLVAAGARGPGSLEVVLVGGGKLEVEAGRAARALGWPVLATYGMTETCSQVATQEVAALGEDFAEGGLGVLPEWEREGGGNG